jgi:hypothetical protein
MRHWWLICACALSLPAASAAAGDHVPFTMIGTGGSLALSSSTTKNNKAQMDGLVQWVWGFISAYNARGFFDVTVQREVSQVSPPDESTVLRLWANSARGRPPVTSSAEHWHQSRISAERSQDGRMRSSNLEGRLYAGASRTHLSDLDHFEEYTIAT